MDVSDKWAVTGLSCDLFGLMALWMIWRRLSALIKFEDDIKMGGDQLIILKCRAAIQKDWGRLGSQNDRNLVKFRKGKCQVTHLGRKKPLWWCSLALPTEAAMFDVYSVWWKVTERMEMSSSHWCLVGEWGIGCYLKQELFRLVIRKNSSPWRQSGSSIGHQEMYHHQSFKGFHDQMR